MFKFLFVIFFFFLLLVFLMGFSILRTIKHVLFGSGTKTQQKRQSCQTDNRSAGKQGQTYVSDRQTAFNRKKIFTKEEGEYVDFEEVK